VALVHPVVGRLAHGLKAIATKAIIPENAKRSHLTGGTPASMATRIAPIPKIQFNGVPVSVFVQINLKSFMSGIVHPLFRELQQQNSPFPVTQ
jgi:hypothetical protein